MNETNSINTNNINSDISVQSSQKAIQETSTNGAIDTPAKIQASAPYYYDYYGEQKTIIENQETIIQNGYVISMLLAITLIVSVLRNMLRR